MNPFKYGQTVTGNDFCRRPQLKIIIQDEKEYRFVNPFFQSMAVVQKFLKFAIVMSAIFFFHLPFNSIGQQFDGDLDIDGDVDGVDIYEYIDHPSGVSLADLAKNYGRIKGKWHIVWEDHFNGAGQPNPDNWNYHVGNGYNPGIRGFQGWGNHELEWYRPENCYQSDGNLVIRAEYYDTPQYYPSGPWYQSSCRITTQGKHSWKYGRIEAKIDMPKAQGAWPAFWMMGDVFTGTYTTEYNPANDNYDFMGENWPSCGEIDIVEHKNYSEFITNNIYWDMRTGVFPWAGDQIANYPNNEVVAGDVSDFHLYTIEWDDKQIRWYVDRDKNSSPTHSIDITPDDLEEFHRPFFIVINLAIGGTYTGPANPKKEEFPLYMHLDYVRVWQK